MPTQQRTTGARSRASTRRKRTRAAPRRKGASADQRGEFELAVTVVRLGVGAVGLGSDEAVRRLRAIQRDTEPASRPDIGKPKAGPLGLSDLAVGVAIESAEVVARLVSTSARGGRRVAARADRLRGLPFVGALQRLSARGREEQVLGRRIVERLIRDTAVSSVADIAQFTVKEVTHSPEVAALVKTQSAGIATDAILEVRANSEQADDRLERRVRSWLHLRGSNGSVQPGP